MKTIAMCAALTALAFWLFPDSNVKNAAEQAEPMVLLVETAADGVPAADSLPETPEEPDEDEETLRWGHRAFDAGVSDGGPAQRNAAGFSVRGAESTGRGGEDLYAQEAAKAKA